MFKTSFLFLSLIFCFKSFALETVQNLLLKNNLSEERVFQFMLEYPDLIGQKIFKMKKLEDTDSELKIKAYLENSNRIVIIEEIGDYLKAYGSENEYKFERQTFDGLVKGSIYDSVINVLDNERIATLLDEAFKDEYTNSKKSKVSAVISFTVEVFSEGDGPVEYQNIVSAKLVVGKAIVEKVLMREKETDSLVLVTLKPNEEDRIFESPVESKRISSLFNLARRHPVKRRIQPHRGVDFVATSGTPVYPALSGKIIAMGRARAKGKFVLIEHDNGYQTTYDHLRKFQKGLRVGDYVDISDKIGEVGRTGYATGAHLHFGVIKDGMFVNPIYYLKDYQLDEESDSSYEEYDESTSKE